MKDEKLIENIEDYVRHLGGNDQDVEQILDEVLERGYTTMEEVMAHIENYY